jgi:pimeloyl-ACP methyl ester carboxylesterase
LRPWSLIALILVVTGISGCMLRDAHRQMAQMDSACVITGTVVGDRDQPGPYIVLLVEGESPQWPDVIRPVDHFVMDSGGGWVFAAQPDHYRILAFRSLDGQLAYAPGDPLVIHEDGQSLNCGPGLFEPAIDLVIADTDQPPLELSIELSRQRDGFLGEGARMMASLGQATAFGEVTTLDHSRFAFEVATDSLWRPVDFMLGGHAGVYFLEPYDPEREIVLLIHGINGSPRVFAELIASLDLERFQTWVYYYPSGIGLNENAEYLTNIMLELELRHGVDRLHVIAHSMGGLVARQFLLNRRQRQSPAEVETFIALSTPWGGHTAASRAVESSPIVLPVWKDLDPDSEFLASLFAPSDDPDRSSRLPESIRKFLLFSHHGGERLTRGTSDGVISLSSLLRPEAQQVATLIYGIDASHAGILSHPDAILQVNRILEEQLNRHY